VPELKVRYFDLSIRRGQHPWRIAVPRYFAGFCAGLAATFAAAIADCVHSTPG
jgi:hypothetical protein